MKYIAEIVTPKERKHLFTTPEYEQARNGAMEYAKQHNISVNVTLVNGDSKKEVAYLPNGEVRQLWKEFIFE